MNRLKHHLLLLVSTILLPVMFAACDDTNVTRSKETGMKLTLITIGDEVILSGTDAGRTFTIKSNIAASENKMIKLVVISPKPDLCYFLTDEITLPKGATETKGKIIFKSKAVEELGSEVKIDVIIACEDVNIGHSSLTYKVKHVPTEKPVVEEITVSIKSKATDIVQVSGADVPVEIAISADKKPTEDLIVELTTSGALTSRYTLMKDQVTIKAGETSATTSILFHDTELIYTSSRADVKVDLECKTAKVSPTSGTVTVSAIGATPITIPSSDMSDNNKEELTLNLGQGELRARMPIWNIRETAEDMVFLFEVIGAEYGKEYGNNFNTPMPIVRIPKYTGTGSMGSTDFYVDFYASAFSEGTHQVTLRGTIISGSARFGGKEARETTEINVTIIK